MIAHRNERASYTTSYSGVLLLATNTHPTYHESLIKASLKLEATHMFLFLQAQRMNCGSQDSLQKHRQP